MPPSLSLRHYLRWLPDPVPEEDNTSTIVTTSNEHRFVDLRVFNQALSSEKIQSLSQLEWGLAGTSSSVPAKGSNGEEITHGVWKHWIDSRSLDADGVQDEGDNYPLPDGKILEKGRMVNPETGKLTDYEEVWEDLKVERVGSEAQCIVLQVHDEERGVRGLVVRVGQFCQGIIRVGSEVSVERWAWGVKDHWKRTVRMGKTGLPCGEAMEPARLKLGDKINCGEHEWTVIELLEE